MGGDHKPAAPVVGSLAAADSLGRDSWLTEVLAHVADVVTVIGDDGVVLYTNRSAESLPGWRVGQRAAEGISSLTRDLWLDAFASALESGVAREVEVATTTNSWWRMRLVPVSEHGGVRAIISVATDVSAEKVASKERARSEAALGMALEASGMGLWRWNVGADVVHWDPVAKALFEWPAEQEPITYADFLSRVVPEDRERVRLHVARSVESCVYEDLLCRIAVPSGISRHILVKGRVLVGPDGAATDLLGGVMDVTRKREVELQIARLQKLEAIGQLAGGIAHDFNNLLVAILGNVDLAERASTADVREHYLEETRHAARRAAELTKQLLTFGRRQQLRESEFDLCELLQDTSRLLDRLMPENIELRVDAVPSRTRVLGDRAQVEQVVMNLCLNARDAMSEGGRLHVATQVVHLDGSQGDGVDSTWAVPGHYVELSVSDTGKGISLEHRDRLFEPFFTTKPTGTGLGLATAWGIVKRHAGHMSVDSELGVGTTFRVYLPVADGASVQVAEPLALRPAGGSESLLIAEDQHEVRNILVRILADAGYQVHVAKDGVEALEKYREHRAAIRCVVLDAVMPRQGGVEALVGMRQLSPRLPAIISTGYSDQLPSPAVLPGVHFLPKPFEIDALLNAVRAAIDGAP